MIQAERGSVVELFVTGAGEPMVKVSAKAQAADPVEDGARFLCRTAEDYVELLTFLDNNPDLAILGCPTSLLAEMLMLEWDKRVPRIQPSPDSRQYAA